MARRHASRACWPPNPKSNNARRQGSGFSLHAATFQGSQAGSEARSTTDSPGPSLCSVTQKAFGNCIGRGEGTLLPVNNHLPVRPCFQRALLHIPRRYLTTKSPPATAASATAICRKAQRHAASFDITCSCSPGFRTCTGLASMLPMHACYYNGRGCIPAVNNPSASGSQLSAMGGIRFD
jgi:hypothetical protein